MIDRETMAASWASRPWWLNLVWYFCLYMTFIYMPFDMFTKPYERWEEVWFGVMLHGWPAKLTEPLHWLIYGGGAYGIWKMRPWVWPWGALYCAQITIAMVVWPLLYTGEATGDESGAGWVFSVVAGSFFATLTWAMHRARPLFNNPADVPAAAATEEEATP